MLSFQNTCHKHIVATLNGCERDKIVQAKYGIHDPVYWVVFIRHKRLQGDDGTKANERRVRCQNEVTEKGGKEREGVQGSKNGQ